MTEDNSAFEKQVRDNLTLFTTPDYTAKGDAVNFFKFNAQRAIPILEQLVEQGHDVAQLMLDVAQRHSADEKGNGTFTENNPHLF